MAAQNGHHQTGYVKTEVHGHIATIEFFHPQSNSLPGKLLFELSREITAAGHNNDVYVVVLRSGGDRAFCAGASFEELIEIKNEAEGLQFFSGFAYVINAMRHCNKLIIARIQGKCVGGGVGLAAAADYAIATKHADVKLSELAIGIGPFVIGPAVERKIGVAAFSQLAIDATEWRSAEWACQHGLFAEICGDVEALDKSVAKLAGRLAASNPEAMAEMKKMFWNNAKHADDLLLERAATSGKLILSGYSKNAIDAFKQKAK